LNRSGGTVVIDSGDGDAVASGAIAAQSGDRGGSVEITGRRVALAGTARIDVSGASGGGSVAIGGGAHGADASIRNA
jgi:hypothetical protein